MTTTTNNGSTVRDEFLRDFKREWAERVLATGVNPHIAARDLREYLAKGRLAWSRPTEFRRTPPRVVAALRMREAWAEVEEIAPSTNE